MIVVSLWLAADHPISLRPEFVDSVVLDNGGCCTGEPEEAARALLWEKIVGNKMTGRGLGGGGERGTLRADLILWCSFGGAPFSNLEGVEPWGKMCPQRTEHENCTKLSAALTAGWSEDCPRSPDWVVRQQDCFRASDPTSISFSLSYCSELS